MFISRNGVSITTILSLIVGFMGLLGLVFALVSGKIHQQHAHNNQRLAMTELIRIKTDDIFSELKEMERKIGLALQSKKQFRQAFKQLDQNKMNELLENEFHRFYTTTGKLKFEKLAVYNLEYELFTEQAADNSVLPAAEIGCKQILSEAAKRQGAERLRAFSVLCEFQHKPYHTSIVPIGGLRVMGYLLITTDPVYNLSHIENGLGMPVAIRLPGQGISYQSSNWHGMDDWEVITAVYTIPNHDGTNTMDVMAKDRVVPIFENIPNTSLLVMIVVSCITLLSLFIATSIFRRTTIKPLNQLTKYLNDVAEDKTFLGKKITIKGGAREIKALSISFNLMTNELGDLYKSLESRIRERTQELEVSRDQAETANRSKSDFLSTMSHEIRTPMNGVTGMLELLQRSPLQEDQQRFVAIASQSASNLLDIINEILDFSKIEAGQLKLETTMFNLLDLVEHCATMLVDRANTQETEIICDFDTSLPVYVMGDPTRLRQILINLMGNAVKFTHNGQVILRCQSKATPTYQVHFEVVDNGIGISQEAQLNLFDAFTQADGSTARKYGGTGLGLTISQRLTQMMGDRLRVDSKPGEGSCFHFDLMLAPADEQKHDEMAFNVESEFFKNARVLVVDDNLVSLEVISRYLDYLGINHDTVSNAEDVMAFSQTAQSEGRPYTLVLLDQNMPTTDGAELVHNLKNLFAKLQIILLSTSSLLTSEVIKMGYSASVAKPIQLAQLSNTIHQVLDPDTDLSSKSQAIITTNNEFHGTVLLVDDHEVNLMMAGITLNKMGLRVLQANNGQEAIDAWQQGGIDLILMDVQMPTMDGYEATRTILELEEQQHKAHVPIIAMTANVLVEDRLEAEQAGMDDHLPKPFKWEQLEAILSKWLPAENKHVLTSELTETTDTKVMSENEFTVLDAARIAESIRTLGEHYPRMVDMTIASVKKSIDLLQQASEDDNIATLGSEAHRLKGAVGTMGGPQMMDICRLIELYAESNDLVLAQQQVELLASAFENLQSALKQTLEESSQDLT